MEDITQYRYIVINKDKTTELFKSTRNVSEYINSKISHSTINRRLKKEKSIFIDNKYILALNFT